VTGTLNFGNVGSGCADRSRPAQHRERGSADRTAPGVIKFNGTAGIAVVGGTDNKLRINRFELERRPGDRS
jgi:hypothetical protein